MGLLPRCQPHGPAHPLSLVPALRVDGAALPRRGARTTQEVAVVSWWRRAPFYYGGIAALLLIGAMVATGWVVVQPPRVGHQSGSGPLADALWADLQEAERAHNWALMDKLAQRLLQLSPEASREAGGVSRAEQARQRALLEQHNLLVYDRFLQAAARRAPDAAVLSYGELTHDSVYRELGAARFREMLLLFVSKHIVDAKEAAERAGCRGAQPHLDAIAAVDPSTSLRRILPAGLLRCLQPGPGAPTGGQLALLMPRLSPRAQEGADHRAVSADRANLPIPALQDGTEAPRADPQPPANRATQARRAAPQPAPRVVAGRERPPPDPPNRAGSARRGEAQPAGEARWARPAEGAQPPYSGEGGGERPPPLEEAQRAYIEGNYHDAIAIALRHLKGEPLRAWRVIGGAACYLRDDALVRETLAHLDDPSQRFVRHICERNGLIP